MARFANSDLFALDGTQFTNNPTTKRLVTEASDVGFSQTHQLYDDAIDEGITIRGKRLTLDFYLAEVQKDSDQDVQVWIFKPTTETICKARHLDGYTVHILND